jgi:hypothetical protein
MARMLVTLDGRSESNGTPLLMHNERLADPLDPYALEIAKISKKRGKTEQDHLEIARLEFVGGLYHDDDLGPYIPGWHVIRCIQNAGKQHKLGASVLRGVVPATEKAPVQYDGPRDIEAMWKDGRFALRKSVGIGSSRTMRTRPLFTEWTLAVEIEVDLRILDPEKINQLAEEAGRYQALGDYRPVYGRFLGAAKLVEPAKAAREKAMA